MSEDKDKALPHGLSRWRLRHPREDGSYWSTVASSAQSAASKMAYQSREAVGFQRFQPEDFELAPVARDVAILREVAQARKGRAS